MRIAGSYVLAVAVLIAGSASAQISDTQILGLVTDQQDTLVAGAKVTARHVETGEVYSTTTNEVGLYRFPTLPVGNFQVTVVAPGFKREIRSDIVLRVADRVQVNFRLELGTVSESLVVSGTTPLVETSSSEVGAVVGSDRMANLPLSGRNVMSLVVLTPSVRSVAVSSGGFSDRGLAVSAFVVNGGVSGMNNIMLDGTTNVSIRLGDQSVNPTVDSIEEFKVQSGTISAEFGHTGGGVVTIVTKSGTNQFHGSLYEFLRNSATDARMTFAATKSPLRYNQYGGVLGGPIKKNKSFFFFNLEQWRYLYGQSLIGTVPTVAQRSGDFSALRGSTGVFIPIYDPLTTVPNPSGAGDIRSPLPNNTIPATRLDPVAKNILAYYPLPNQTPNNAFAQTNNDQAVDPNAKHATEVSAKIDHQFSPSNHLSGHYMEWVHHDDHGGQGYSYFTDPLVRGRLDDYANYNIALSDTHIFSPSLINEFKLGVVLLHFTYKSAAAGTDTVSKLGLPASVPDLTLPAVSVPPLSSFPAQFAPNIGINTEYTVQVLDGITWTKGKHSLKLGMELRRNLYNADACGSCSGAFNFTPQLTANPQQIAGTGSAVASFLLGAVATASGEADDGYSFRNFLEGYYVQDDWKISRRLTLNLGLRYDYQSPPVERDGSMTRFNLTAINPDTGLPGSMQYGNSFGGTPWKPDYLDFAPRIGFALDVFGDGRTALRGGYGIYYPLTFMWSRNFSKQGFTSTTSYGPPGGDVNQPAFYLKNGFPFPVIPPAGAALGTSAYLSQGVAFDENPNGSAYAQQFSMTLQRQLGKGFMVQGGYSGSKSSKLVAGNYDYDQLDPKYLAMGNALLNSVPNPYHNLVPGAYGGATITEQQLLRPYPYYSAVTDNNPHLGSSIYHSLIVSMEKRMSHGFVLLASYTKGKMIDNGLYGYNQSGTEQVNVLTYQNGKYNMAAERSVDSNDVPQRFALSGVYELPFGSGKRWHASNKLLGALSDGWQLNGVLTLQRGMPVVISGANNNIATRPNSTGVSANLSNPSASEWFNTSQFVNPPNWTFGNLPRTLPNVRNPGIVNVDLSLFKTIKLRESLHLQVRAESFNLMNHANLLGPNGTFVPGSNGQNNSATFGTITTSRDARSLQFALRLIF